MNAWTGHEPLRHPRPVTQPAQITVPRDRSLTITWQSLFLGMCLGWATLGTFLRAFGDTVGCSGPRQGGHCRMQFCRDARLTQGRGRIVTEEELKAIEERLKSGLGTFVSDRADVAAMAAEIRRLWFVNAEIRRNIGYKSKGTI